MNLQISGTRIRILLYIRTEDNINPHRIWKECQSMAEWSLESSSWTSRLLSTIIFNKCFLSLKVPSIDGCLHCGLSLIEDHLELLCLFSIKDHFTQWACTLLPLALEATILKSYDSFLRTVNISVGIDDSLKIRWKFIKKG